jgi:hypothetical protein
MVDISYPDQHKVPASDFSLWLVCKIIEDSKDLEPQLPFSGFRIQDEGLPLLML